MKFSTTFLITGVVSLGLGYAFGAMGIVLSFAFATYMATQLDN